MSIPGKDTPTDAGACIADQRSSTYFCDVGWHGRSFGWSSAIAGNWRKSMTPSFTVATRASTSWKRWIENELLPNLQIARRLHADFHEEAIARRRRKFECLFLFDPVAVGKDLKIRKIIFAVERVSAALGHEPQKQRMDLWPRTIDFIEEEDREIFAVPQDRSRIDFRPPVLAQIRIVDEIARHQIDGTFDPLVGAADRPRHSAQQGRLADANIAFKQDMAARENRDRQKADDAVLPNDRFRDFFLEISACCCQETRLASALRVEAAVIAIAITEFYCESETRAAAAARGMNLTPRKATLRIRLVNITGIIPEFVRRRRPICRVLLKYSARLALRSSMSRFGIGSAWQLRAALQGPSRHISSRRASPDNRAAAPSTPRLPCNAGRHKPDAPRLAPSDKTAAPPSRVIKRLNDRYVFMRFPPLVLAFTRVHQLASQGRTEAHCDFLSSCLAVSFPSGRSPGIGQALSRKAAIRLPSASV